MRIKGAFRTVIGTLFRWLPLSVEPGLRIFGHPTEESPVFVTANFDLTVKRVTRHLRNLDCYLLVAPTGGINVWCAAAGDNFTAHSVISAIKTSGISDKVATRTLILPQLAAPGVDVELVKKETGWNCKFGPVYAVDIPEYVANGFKKTDNMRRVRWPLGERLDIGFGVSTPMLLAILIILAIFMRSWLEEFTTLGFGLVALMFGFYPLIPGKAAWHKLLFVEGLIGIGLLVYILTAVDRTGYILNLFFWSMGLVLFIGIDFAGTTPFQKSQLDPWLDRLGIRRIGPVNFTSRAKIITSKIILNQAKCTACGICYDVCPMGVYDVEKDQHQKVVVKYPERCEACEACVLQCPEGALSFGAQF